RRGREGGGAGRGRRTGRGRTGSERQPYRRGTVDEPTMKWHAREYTGALETRQPPTAPSSTKGLSPPGPTAPVAARNTSRPDRSARCAMAGPTLSAVRRGQPATTVRSLS